MTEPVASPRVAARRPGYTALGIPERKGGHRRRAGRDRGDRRPAGPAPGAFVDELKALEGELDKLSEASEDLEPAPLVEAAEALKPRLAEVEKRAEDAGLSDGFTHDERFFIPDAVRAPVFAEQLAKLDRSLLRRIERIDFAEASTPGEFAQAFSRYSEVIDTAVEGIDTLDPTQWAADQTAE